MTNHDGILYRAATAERQERLYVPPPLRRRVIQEWHDNASHPGRDQKQRNVMERYFWEKLAHHVRTYVQDCQRCLTGKRGAIQPRVLMGPYPRKSTGKTHLLVITDQCT